MSGVLLSLLPLFAWGLSDFSAAKLSKSHPAAVNFLFSATGLLHVAVVLLFLGAPEISFRTVLPHFIGAVILSFGFIAFVKAYSHGAVGVVTPIANSYAVVTAVISTLFLGIAISLLGWAAIAVVLAGIVLLTYEKSPHHNFEEFNKSVRFSVAALLLFGIGFTFFDIASTQAWYQNFALFQIVHTPVAAVLFLMLVKKDKAKNITQVMRSPWAYIGFTIGTVGTIGLFAAVEVTGNATIPAVVSAASPLVTSYLAYFLSHERLSALQRTGSIVVVTGIILLSL